MFALLAGAFVSLVSFIGVFFIKLEQKALLLKIFVSLAVGALIGDVFFHIIPEISEEGWNLEYSYIIVAAIIFSFVLESLLKWRHSHDMSTADMPTQNQGEKKYLGWLNAFSDGLHNFVDGISIAAAFAVSPSLGVATTSAIVFHEIPQEVGDFAFMIKTGLSRNRALLFNFLSGVAAVVGVLVANLILNIFPGFEVYASLFAAGNLLYLALSDIIPEIHNDHQAKFNYVSFIAILVGLALMLGLLLIEPVIFASEI